MSKPTKTKDEQIQHSKVEVQVFPSGGFRVNEKSLIEATMDVRKAIAKKTNHIPQSKMSRVL